MPRKQLPLIIQTIAALLLVEIVALLAASKLTSREIGAIVQLPAVDVKQFLIAFVVGTAILVFVIRTSRRRLALEFIFTLAIFAGIWFLLSTVVSPEGAVIFAAALVALRYFVPLVLLTNFTMMAGIAGIATSLGAGTPWPSVAVVLAVLAVYDVIAVYGTEHMVTMFKGLLERGVILALIIPEHPRLLLKRLREIKPGEGFFFLGTGDIALPSIFVVSALKSGPAPTFGAVAGSVAGLLFTDLLFAAGRKRPMPALPPIAVGTMLGFLVGLLIQRYV